MKRRGFFGALIGLALAPFGARAASPYVMGVDTGTGASKSVLVLHQERLLEEIGRRQRALRQAVCDQLEEDLWGVPLKTNGPTLMGTKHFILKT